MGHASEIIRTILIDAFAVIWVLSAWYFGAPTNGWLARFTKSYISPFLLSFSLCHRWEMFTACKIEGCLIDRDILTLIYLADGSQEILWQNHFSTFEYRYFCLNLAEYPAVAEGILRAIPALYANESRKIVRAELVVKTRFRPQLPNSFKGNFNHRRYLEFPQRQRVLASVDFEAGPKANISVEAAA